MTTLPFGSWKSPISSALLVDKTARLTSLQVDRHHIKRGGHRDDNTIYWTELRPSEKGRVVLCSKKIGEEEVSTWTIPDHNARTRVHEYGEGAVLVHHGAAYYSNFSDQRLYVSHGPSSHPKLISPADKHWRFADARADSNRNILVTVREDHTNEHDVINTIVAINLSDHSHHVLVSGADFYASPRISHSGKQLAWVEWNHPNMPWDTTSLWVAELNEAGTALVEGTKKKIAGGHEESVVYPSWSNQDHLTFISDRTDWWNIYQVDDAGNVVELFIHNSDLCGPHWVFGNTPYAFDPHSDQILVNFTLEGKGQLALLDPKTKNLTHLQSGFFSHSYLNITNSGHVVVLTSDPTKPSALVSISLQTKEAHVEYVSSVNKIEADYLSYPRTIEFPTENGLTAFGYFYPPKNKDFKAPDGELPPLLVRAHGGPTAACSSAFTLGIQYWTSRGFGFLDVNYGGSTGYGRNFRERLRGKWGIVDLDDCCNGALYLANVTKEVDIKRLAIDGGSAGGFTTLAVLAFRKVFAAGCSNYGVSDLEALAKETHKFESRYLDNLIGKYPEERDIYLARSPIHHVSGFNCPLILFQGDEDKIVPPNQAEMMYEAVKSKGIPVAYVLFQGEQHGFRKAENILKNIDWEFYFFSKVFGFKPADEINVEFKIENLDLAKI